jgi:hypothetical protein
MVHARPRLVALAPALLLLAAACGKSKQAKLFDQIVQDCGAVAANGLTLDQALIQFRGAELQSILQCRTDLGNLPPPNTDTCGTPSAENPVCDVFLEWAATDNNLCNPGGGCCLLCEIRVKQSEFQAKQGEAPVCASRAAQGQICQLF